VHITDQSIRFSGGPLGFLLIHGLGGTPIEMRYVAQGLARAGHTVHVPQLAGHCGGAKELRATTWQHWYESVEIEHRLLRETCYTVVVGGLSMGAVLAFHHAAQVFLARDEAAWKLEGPVAAGLHEYLNNPELNHAEGGKRESVPFSSTHDSIGKLVDGLTGSQK
jgi:dienelactone hydrolase